MTQSPIPAPFSRQRATQLTNTPNDPSNVPRTVPQYHQETGLQVLARDPPQSITASGISVTSSLRVADLIRRTSPTLMNGFPSNAPLSVMYVRALYDYEADDRTSLSFHEGDVIQVITQLESGWWDGVINGVRGWFPSNYCQVLPSTENVLEESQQGEHEEDEDMEEDEEYEDQYEDDEGESERDDLTQLPIEGNSNTEKARADFWIPQATPDGRLFYFNTMTGESSMELPLESPSSANENGPRDRMNVNVPDKTRPPPEMMAQGYVQDEDYESEGNSASELDGESIMLASGSSLVCHIQQCEVNRTDQLFSASKKKVFCI
jgi:son of sevenless